MEHTRRDSWRAQYRFQLTRIDDQHNVLFDLLDALESALQTAERWVVLHSILEDIQHWAKIHFAVEEALMEILHYPALADHVTAHLGFLRMLELRKAAALKQDIAMETAAWLRDWLRLHIDVEDRRYVEHFRRLCPPPAGAGA